MKNRLSSFVSKHSPGSRRPPALLVFLVAATLSLVSVLIPAAAADRKAAPPITLSQLAGRWQATTIGQGGCGFGSKLVTFTLNSIGEARNTTYRYHTVSCGDGEYTGQKFTITSLNSNGTGSAELGVGNGIVLTFNIQVSADHQVFNMGDITDYQNYEEGTAIHLATP